MWDSISIGHWTHLRTKCAGGDRGVEGGRWTGVEWVESVSVFSWDTNTHVCVLCVANVLLRSDLTA